MTHGSHPDAITEAAADELAESAATLARLGRYREAWDRLSPAMHRPTARVLLVAAGLQLELGDPSLASDLAHRAAAQAGGATAHAVLGDVHRRLGRAGEAEAAYRAALAIDPRHAASLVNLARVLCTGPVRRLAEAEDLLEFAVSTHRGFAAAECNLATVRLEQGRAGEAVRGLLPMAGASANVAVWRQLAMVAQYDDATNGEVLAEYHRHTGTHSGVPRVKRGGSVGGTPEGTPGRIAVGLMSPDFRNHPVSRFVLSWLPRLSRDEFRVIGIDLSGVMDGANTACRAVCDEWIEAWGLTDEASAAAIAERGIDVLIDLAGLTSGARPGILERRPARVQFTAVGYPGETGLDGTSGFLGDGHTDPAGGRAIDIGRCFLCYLPEKHSVAGGGAAIGVPEGKPLFASFNALSKVSPTTLRLWSRVLGATPGSSLLVKSGALDDTRVAARFVERARAAGVSRERLSLAGLTPGHGEHLAAYGQVHVALDTYPYHGTTTTCEALSMGVPVVSLIGDRHAARVGLSLLTAVGETGLASATEDEFVAVAAGLAFDRSRLRRLRSELPARVVHGPLGDGAGYADAMAATLRRLTYAPPE